MFLLRKLSELPRSQMLRKAAKIIGEAEQRFVLSVRPGGGDWEYFAELAELLIKTGNFSAPGTEVLENAAQIFRQETRRDFICENACTADDNTAEVRRALNGVYQLLLAETGRAPADWDFIESSDKLDLSRRQLFPGMQVYLEDIRSPFNIGSMFRAAESFGVEKIWLSPLSADPYHRRAERTAMGCVDAFPWERFTFNPFSGRIETGAAVFPFSELPFFAMETGGVPLEDFRFPTRGVMIVGSEELGVSPKALAASDACLGRVSIPVFGAKGSLNVSVAFGIVMQAWAVFLARLYERS